MWEGKIELTNQQVEYVAELARTGLYGQNADAVLKELVLMGLREAFRGGMLKPTQKQTNPTMLMGTTSAPVKWNKPSKS